MAAREKTEEAKNKIESLAEIISADKKCDIFCYFGDIERDAVTEVVRKIKNKRKARNILLVLATYGGDPHAAFIMGRAFQTFYKTKNPFKADSDPHFFLFIPTLCKSAGTLLAISADSILMSHDAEFGPLDIQLRKPDEIGERTSGLTPIQALDSLQSLFLQKWPRKLQQILQSA
jgi:ClpP class serine protease